MSNHGTTYWQARSQYEEMTGLDYDKRHRWDLWACRCDGSLVDCGAVVDRRNWAGYSLRELGVA